MTQREEIAEALAFFEETEDAALLHQLLGDIAPRARRMVGQLLAQGGDEAVPPPAELRAARSPASRESALRTLRTVNDFALLQVLARTIGQRVEAAEIAASADFPRGTRVRVPEKVSFPAHGPWTEGVVEVSGTQLSVLLDSGETWEGPPTLAQLASPAPAD